MERSRVLSDDVYHYILDLIFAKQLKPGDKIPEAKIASTFEISRTPVRDAMKLLANEGLLEILPNRFARLKEYSEKEIKDIGIMRIALDEAAVKLAALFGSRADFLNLQKIADECNAADEKKEFALRDKLDCDFHFGMAQLSKNQLLIKYQKELNMRVQYILTFYTFFDQQMIAEQINQHVQIVRALLDNNCELAISISIEHLIKFYRIDQDYPKDFFKV